MRVFILVVSIALLCVSVFAGVIKDGSLRANSDNNYITVSWLSEDETSVANYVLERKAGINGAFVPVTEFPAKGNNSAYEFVDDNAFRVSESIYKYQVKVVFSNGQAPVFYGPITVSHRTSDVRRTWGSIKAMFQ